jgi:hypothetical protein
MSHLPEFREVRVTPRGARLTPNGKLTAVTPQFIAPDVAPVPTLAWELEKGKVGWTDFDKRVETVTDTAAARRKAAADLKALAMGETVIREPRPAITRVVSAGPSKSYRAAQLAAQELAERNCREARAKRARNGK